MLHKAVLTALAAATVFALSAAPALADGSVAGAGSSDLIDSGSAALGSSSNKPAHFGKLGRPDADNGVYSINTWVKAPTAKAISTDVYPKNSKIGVRWNSTIKSGEEVGGDGCKMVVTLTGPKVPVKAGTIRTTKCTSSKLFMLRAAGDYSIRVTDSVSGASNAVKFSLQ